MRPMISLFRERKRFFILVTVLAIVFRLGFVFFLPFVNDDDTAFYAEIAHNIVANHQYAQDGGDAPFPTLVRLPGYPALLALDFWIFGTGKYLPVLIFQLLCDVLACVLLADLARRILGDRAAMWTCAMAALCPFTANYAATALTECLEIFFTVLAFQQALVAVQSRNRRPWIFSGLATAAAILLRPDGGLVLITLALLAAGLAWRDRTRLRELALGVVLMAAIALAPLVPWTIRNWKVFHVFQPLVSMTASNPDEFSPQGWSRWMKSWMTDYSQIVSVSWKVGSSDLDIGDIPRYAFDDRAQFDKVNQLFNDYNTHNHEVTREWDAQFRALADEAYRRHPLRCYVLLPFARTADMWFQPRTEAIVLGDHGWDDDERVQGAITISLAALNAALVLAALFGLLRARRQPHVALLWAFLVVRSAFLGLAGVCEQRYTVECIPFALVLAAGWLAGVFTKKHADTAAA